MENNTSKSRTKKKKPIFSFLRKRKSVLFADPEKEFIENIINKVYPLTNIISEKTDSLNHAESLVKKNYYDLIVTSLVFPDNQKKDGRDFAESIAANGIDLITLSKFPFNIYINSNAHVQKGYKDYKDKLVEAIAQVLEKKSAESHHEFINHITKDSEKLLEDLVNSEDKDYLDTFLYPYSSEKSISKEIKGFANGEDGRDKGFITEKSALYNILRRRHLCTKIANRHGIKDPKSKVAVEETMWNFYREQKNIGRAIPHHSALNLAVHDIRKKENKDDKTPTLLVLVGASGSGKTTLARHLDNKNDYYWIGNLKTGEKRIENTKDKYIDKKEAEKLLEKGKISPYTHLEVSYYKRKKIIEALKDKKDEFHPIPRTYYSQDELILETLKKGMDTVIVRNIDGLKSALRLVNQNPVNAKIITVKLDAHDEAYKRRISSDTRLTSEEEEYIRKEILNPSIDEYNQNQGFCDIELTTSTGPEDRPIEETHTDLIKKINSYIDENPISSQDVDKYINQRISSFIKHDGSKLDYLLKKAPFSIPVEDPKTNEEFNVEVAAVDKTKSGILTFYLNPLVEGKKEEPDIEKINKRKTMLIQYLEHIYREKAEKSNPVYDPKASSNFSQKKVSYKNNWRIKTDDIALFSVRNYYQNREYRLKGNRIHSIAFVGLEQKIDSEIKFTEL